MKIIENIITFIGAIIGFIGGGIWAYHSNYDYEPIILICLSALTILGFIVSRIIPKKEEIIKSEGEIGSTQIKNHSSQNVKINLNIGETEKPNSIAKLTNKTEERNAFIESQKPKTHILFIDDDTKFKTVKMFKDSGWKNTLTVKDVKSIDLPNVQNADIIFVDINGVGKLLELEYEGLDLAFMIKQKYPHKKVVIYSANKNSNSFHRAWDIIDARIEKNALPIQFQNVADNYCLSKYKTA
jgi:hypothetical protein